MLESLNAFNFTIFILFLLLYLYQIIYAGVVLCGRKKPTPEAKQMHRYGVIIAARNEATVIRELLQSIKAQNYPDGLVTAFVVADNCTDNTAELAQAEGAVVYERFNQLKVGKGYALDYAFKHIMKEYPEDWFEAYFVFDADNLLDPNYIREMNKVFDSGYAIITSYRNSKNYDSNWISAGYSLWFLRESKYLNQARMMCGSSCAISGTGFMISNQIVKANNGWKHHLLTEDIEFSVDSVLHGLKIGYCGDAVLYDEQPCTFEQSWKQRLRWSKGFYQVFGKYGQALVKRIFKEHDFSSYDMTMTIAPALFVSLFSVLINSLALLWTLFIQRDPEVLSVTLGAITASVTNYYLILYAFGILTTVTEWDNIHCSAVKKILYTFTFPIFIFTYVPIAIEALFKKIEWSPITHTIAKSIQEIRD